MQCTADFVPNIHEILILCVYTVLFCTNVVVFNAGLVCVCVCVRRDACVCVLDGATFQCMLMLRG